MPRSPHVRPRRRRLPFRRLTLFLQQLGVTSVMVAVAGMILGILAGVAFMATEWYPDSTSMWAWAATLCLLCIATVQLDLRLQPSAMKLSREEEFYNELPERVSDAVTLIGFGFAIRSSPVLGLVAALAAIFSAYIRSLSNHRLSPARRRAWILMTRSQRLALLTLASVAEITPLREYYPNLELARYTLAVIVAGCLITVIQRWFHLREIKV